ncbi:MAG: hypothetical protein ACRCZB_01955 [Bacteroidales bacterium]
MKTNFWNVKQAFCALIMSATVLTSCDKDQTPNADTDDNNSSDATTMPTRLTIAGAEYIYPNPNASNAITNSVNERNSVPSYMYIDAQGVHKPIRFVGTNNDTMDLEIYEIKNLNKEYIILFGEFNFSNEKINAMLVNKTTEAIYSMGDFRIRRTDCSGSVFGYVFYEDVYEDENKNLYTEGELADETTICKINVSNPNAITISNYIPKNQSVCKFIVNKRGVCTWSDKIQAPMGRIYPIRDLLKDQEPSSSSSYYDYDYALFKGLVNDNLHIITHRYNSPTLDEPKGKTTYRIYEITEPDKNTLSINLIDELQLNDSYYGIAYFPNTITKTHLCPISNNEKTNRDIIEYSESTKKLSLKGVKDIIQSGEIVITASNALFYNKESFTLLNLSDYNVNIITLSGKYELYSIQGDMSSDNATFSGLRFEDGRNIVGTIDKTGNFNAIESINATPETILTRLN